MTVQKRWLGLAALVVVVAVAIAVPVRLAQRSGMAAGTQLQVDDTGTLDRDGLRSGTIRLPTGELTVQVTSPATHFPADADLYGEDVEPDRVARSGRWLGVGWTLRTLPLPTAQLLVLGRTPAQFQVALVADGTRYDLSAGRTEDAYAATESRAGLAIAGRKLTLVDHKRVFVALPRTPKKTSVEVTYDGLTQRFDPDSRKVDGGPAAPLYRPAAERKVTTTRAISLAAPGFGFLRDRNDVQVDLGVRPVTPLPYVPGLGWAKEGRSWLVAPILTNIVDPFVYWPTPEASAHALYRLKLTVSTATLDGAKPATELAYYQQNPKATDSTSSVYYIWDVAAAATGQTLALHQDYVSGPPDDESPGTAPKQAAATADATFTL